MWPRRCEDDVNERKFSHKSKIPTVVGGRILKKLKPHRVVDVGVSVLSLEADYFFSGGMMTESIT